MTWLRAKLRQWLEIDSDISTVVELVAAVEKSVINLCAETHAYCSGRIKTLTEDSGELNQRYLDLRAALVKLETKTEPAKAETEPLDPAGSWSVIKNRASRGRDAA